MIDSFAGDGNDIAVSEYGLDIATLLYRFFGWLSGGGGVDGGFSTLLDFFGRLWNVYSLIAIILSLLFFLGFVYAKIRLAALSEIEQSMLREAERMWAERFGGARPSYTRWGEIQKHIHDDNPNSWKIAIIEADIFLEEILNDRGYVGMTIGDKLKTANTSSFTTIQDAWEAHKVRNEIAHNSGDFILTRKIAQETLTRYERVFREFGAI
jgi:hypothetical protein